MRAGAVCEATGRNYSKKVTNGWVKVYIVMGACYWIKVPQWSVKTAKRQKKKKKRPAVLFSGARTLTLITCRKTGKICSNERQVLARTESSLLSTTFHLVTICPQYRAPVASQPEPLPFVPCCSCSFFWTRDAFLKFGQSYETRGWQQVSSSI